MFRCRTYERLPGASERAANRWCLVKPERVSRNVGNQSLLDFAPVRTLIAVKILHLYDGVQPVKVPSHTSLDEPKGSASRPERNTNLRFGFLTVPSKDASESQGKDSQMARKIALRVERLEVRELLSSLAYSLTTDKSTYQVGQPVQLTFTETNTSTKPVTVTDGPSIDGFTVTGRGHNDLAVELGDQCPVRPGGYTPARAIADGNGDLVW